MKFNMPISPKRIVLTFILTGPAYVIFRALFPQSLSDVTTQLILSAAFLAGCVVLTLRNYSVISRIKSYLPALRVQAAVFFQKKMKNKDVYFPLAIGFLSGAIVYFRWVNVIGRFSTLFGIVIASLVFFFSCLIMTDK